MRRREPLRHWLTVASWLLAAHTAEAQSGIAIEAGNLAYSRDGAVIEASGGVRASWDGNELVAESLRYESDLDLLTAVGGVVLDTPDVLMEAASCSLRVEEEIAELRDVNVEVKDSRSTFGGRAVRKRPGLRFELEDAYFTTCELKEDRAPDWSITGGRADVEVDGYGRVDRAAFRVRGVPLLYAPVLLFPAMTNRHSGLLMPRLGASDKRGFMYSQPYYWAIDKHQDLTVTAEVETAARLGVGLEYRYTPSRTTVGDAQLYYYNEDIRTESETDVQSPLFEPKNGEDIPENRVVFEGHHRQRPTRERRFYGDVLLVSDDLVLRETDAVEGNFFGRDPRRGRYYTDSRLGVLSSRESPALGFASYGYRAAYYQNLIAPDRYTVQQPGRLWVNADGDLPYGLDWRFDSQLGAFRRTDGDDGQRLDVSTTLNHVLIRGGGPVRASTWARGRLTGYRNADRSLVDVSPPGPRDDPSTPQDETEVGEPLGTLDRWAGRGVGEAGVDLWTGFMRRYAFAAPGAVVPPPPAGDGRAGFADEPGIWGEGGLTNRFSSLYHTIEPFSSLRFTGVSDQEDLPLYDSLDRIDNRTTLTYGTASRFLFTDARSGRRSELAQLSVAQSYDVNDRVVDDHFSDIDGALSLRPTRAVSFSGLGSYNVGTSSLRGAAATLAWERFRLPLTGARRSQLEAAYRFVRRGAVETAEEGLETLEVRTILALTDTFAIGANGRYDFVGNELVESGGGIRIESSCRCWTVDLGVINRVNPDELQFRVQLDLGGLASLGSSALRYRTAGLSGLSSDVARARRFGW